MPKDTKEPTDKLALVAIAIVGALLVASFIYALTWPIRIGSMALWSILFSNSMYPQPKDKVKNNMLKIFLLLVFVGGAVIPGLLLPTTMKKALLILSLLPQVHMLVMLRQASIDLENNKKKKSKDPNQNAANELFAKGIVFYAGFALLSIGITVYSIFSD